MNAARLLTVDCPIALGIAQGEEVAMRLGVDAFAEMQQEAR